MDLVDLVVLVVLVDLVDPVNGFIRNRQGQPGPSRANQGQPFSNTALVFFLSLGCLDGCEQIKKTQDEPQWIVAQRLLSALTIPGFN